MISVRQVYEAVRDLANKDQKGFVTPAVFNSLAGVAQQNVFGKLLEDLVQARALRAGQRDPGGGESIYRGIEDDLSEYIQEIKLDNSSDQSVTGDSNLFKKPADFFKLISIRVDGDERTPVDLVYRADQMSHILASNLSAPTELFPVALVSRNIEIFPTDVGAVVMTYYRQPASRYPSNYLDKTRGDLSMNEPMIVVGSEDPVSGFFVINQISSRDFDLPERYTGDLIAEICSMIGVRLRDSVLTQYGQTQTS
jgi:hypothetical protein